MADQASSREERKNRETTFPWLSIWGRGWKTEGSWCPPPSKAPQAAPRESWSLRGPCSDHTPTGARWMGEQGGSQSENPRPIHSTWAWSLPGPSSPRRTCALALHPRPASSPLLPPGPGPLSPHKSEPHSGLSSPPALLPSFLADSAVSSPLHKASELFLGGTSSPCTGLHSPLASAAIDRHQPRASGHQRQDPCTPRAPPMLGEGSPNPAEQRCKRRDYRFFQIR